MSGALLRPPWCRACRNNLLQSLAAISGVPIPPTAPPRRISSLPRTSQKSFSVFNPRLSEHIPSGSPQSSEETPAATDSSAEDGAASITEEHVPWYLQVETPDLPQPPRAAQQDLPPLPDNPPPILEDILKHISIDIGLDDLVLFDLRKLDPPPALGANLIMIIGTARSVKHLNVSADRFCRWLRSTYKLQPDSDGLLGRNELKIKLRRKARRAKLASNAGASLDNHDDGITTGWVCVNAGVVEDAQSDALNNQKNDNFVGFGELAGGTRIVVQMLTEEKRADVDLEGLWADAVARNNRRDKKLSESQQDAPLKEVGAVHDLKATSPSDRDLRATHRQQNSIYQGQRRALHTSRRLQKPDTTVQNGEPEPIVEHSQLSPEGNHNTAAKSNPSTNSTEPSSGSTISLLFQFLSSRSDEEAIQQLGRGPDDHNSTQFLDMFYKALSHEEDSAFALGRLELIRQAITRRHPDYTKACLFKRFNECIVSGYDLSELQMWQVMDTLLLPRPNPDQENPMIQVPDTDVHMALEVLDHMSLRGMNVFSGRVLSSLYRAASFQVPVVATESRLVPVSDEALKRVRYQQIKLEKIMEAAKVRLEPDDFINLLQGQFNQGHYRRYWSFWSKISLLGLPRTEKLYTLFFRLQAERGNQRRCLKLTTSWPEMMEREDPPVHLRGELAEAVMACILVADPNIRDKLEDGSTAELPSLWRRCVAALETDPEEPEYE